MFLIADSGATKTDWCLMDELNNTHRFQTIGFNPYFQTSENIANTLVAQLVPQLKSEHLIQYVETIFFYGAGCSTVEKCNVLARGLKTCFPSSSVEVQHDLLGAARALCKQNEGIAMILGTGSNSCYYDGNNILENVPSLGYILGDEGSGAHIGKKFLNRFLYNELPPEIHDAFKEQFNLKRHDILNQIYPAGQLQKETLPPGRFLASFSPFLLRYIQHPFVSGLIYDCFSEFFIHHICKYEKHREIHVHCTGSVGFYFQEILKQVAKDNKIRLENIIKSPMDELIRFHLEKENNRDFTCSC